MSITGKPLNADLAEKVLAHVDQDEVLAFHRELVQAESVNPPGDVRKALDVCRTKLEAEGFEIEIIAQEDEKPNLLASLKRGEGPTLFFNSHVDVVPTGDTNNWTHPPFGAEIVDGKIYGRGAGDAKGCVAAQVMGAIAFARSGVPVNGTLVVNEVADEEIGGALGAQLVANSEHVQPDFVIVGEQTFNRVNIGEKGGAGALVTTYGRSAHGALPWEGVNAIEGMAAVITALQKDLWPKLEQRTHKYFHHSSATIAIIEGGVKSNVVPDLCTIQIDRRIIPGEKPDDVRAEIQEIAEAAIKDIPGMRVTVEPAGMGGREAILNEPDSPLVQAMMKANQHLGIDTSPSGFSMGTDGRHFHANGYQTIIYGPGDPSTAHKPDEWVGVDELIEATRAYSLAALALLGESNG